MSIERGPPRDTEAERYESEAERWPLLDEDARRWDIRRRETERRRALAAKRSAGPPTVLTVILTMLALFSLTGYQITTETAATRLLGRLGAALIELDRWLPEHREELDLQARDRPDASVRPADLPIDLVLSANEVTAAIDANRLEALLRDTAGSTLYTRSTQAFRDGDGETQSLGFDEPVRWTVQALDKSTHSFWRAVLPITLLVLLAPVAGVLLSGRSPFMPIGVGAGIAAAASLIWWFIAQTIGGTFDAAVDQETMLILRDGAWIGLRNSAAVAVAAFGLMFLFSNLRRGSQRPWQPSVTSDPESSPY